MAVFISTNFGGGNTKNVEKRWYLVILIILYLF